MARQHGEIYAAMLKEVANPFCWACGRGKNSRPSWWHATWLIERAHIVNKPRVEDRRCVVLLCSGCHKGSVHGERFPQRELPRLSVANLIWLKRLQDSAYFDLSFLQRHSVRILPRAAKPPAAFSAEYASRRGKT